MGQYVNNHYIPQQLLSVFSIPNKPDRIFRYEKEYRTILVRPIALLAQQDNFYDIKWEDAYRKADAEGKKEFNALIQSYLHKDFEQTSAQERENWTKIIEKQYFGFFENYYGPQVTLYRQKLDERINELKKGGPFVDSEAKKALARYIAIAGIRSLWFREIALPLLVANNRQKLHLEPKPPSKEYLQFLHVSHILNQNYLKEWEEALLAKKWLLFVNESPTPFILTDNPLSTTGLNIAKYQAKTLMIGDPETISFFPFSPKYQIVFCDKGDFLAGLGSAKEDSALFLSEDFVKAQNEILFDQIVHMAFSPTKEELERLAKNHLDHQGMFLR